MREREESNLKVLLCYKLKPTIIYPGNKRYFRSSNEIGRDYNEVDISLKSGLNGVTPAWGNQNVIKIWFC